MQIVAAEPLPGEGIDGLRRLEDGYMPEILDLSRLDRKLLVGEPRFRRGLRALRPRGGHLRGRLVGRGRCTPRARRARLDARHDRLVLGDGGWKYLSAGLWDTPEDELPSAWSRRLVGDARRARWPTRWSPTPARSSPTSPAASSADARGDLHTFHPARNADASPYRYSVEPDDLLRITHAIDDAGDEVAAIYHSHTMSPA